MFTDLVGYTPLAHSDEAGAMRLLEEQDRLVRPLLARHRGRRIKSMGDGQLIEFANARDAVECAVEIQGAAQERNARPGARPLRIRIGIHVGDVESRGSDILGDAVNIASRIEPLAPAGGICLSAQVYDQVRRKVPFRLEKLAPTQVKGVEEALDLYRVVLPWQAATPEAGFGGATRLAVLPFSNISPDTSDEYFADGLTEELITALSQLKGLQVIARTSVMAYKGTSKPLGQIGSELGVSTVLEGSVRKAGDQLRIAAQLIDVPSQAHKWASTYDRKLDDIFAVQADVAERIAAALKVKIGKSTESRLASRSAVLPESYDAYVKGRALLGLRDSSDAIRKAKTQFEIAATLDSSNAGAFSGLADVTTLLGWWYLLGPRSEWRPAALAFTSHALALDPALAEAHCSLGVLQWDDWDFAAGEEELRKALGLNPSYAYAHWMLSALLQDEGRSDEALDEARIAVDLDPQSPLTLGRVARFLNWYGRPDEAEPYIERLRSIEPESREYRIARTWRFYAVSDFDAAIRELEAVIAERPKDTERTLLVALQALAGRADQARRTLQGQVEHTERRATHENLAAAHAILGDVDEAFRLMIEGAQLHDLALQWIRTDPRFEFLRRDPRFTEVLRAMNLA